MTGGPVFTSHNRYWGQTCSLRAHSWWYILYSCLWAPTAQGPSLHGWARLSQIGHAHTQDTIIWHFQDKIIWSLIAADFAITSSLSRDSSELSATSPFTLQILWVTRLDLLLPMFPGYNLYVDESKVYLVFCFTLITERNYNCTRTNVILELLWCTNYFSTRTTVVYELLLSTNFSCALATSVHKLLHCTNYGCSLGILYYRSS